jgi:predicted solute-binding protein
MRKHIDLYVNEFSVDLGEKVRADIERFYEVFTNEKNDGRQLFI